MQAEGIDTAAFYPRRSLESFTVWVAQKSGESSFVALLLSVWLWAEANHPYLIGTC